MLVWKDGAHHDKNNKHYSTKAGRYYGGHQPCTAGNNYRFCGRWGPPWKSKFKLLLFFNAFEKTIIMWC